MHVADVPYRIILETKIVRETATQWIDDRGDRWRKSSRARVPQIPHDRRYLTTPEDAARELEERRR